MKFQNQVMPEKCSNSNGHPTPSSLSATIPSLRYAVQTRYDNTTYNRNRSKGLRIDDQWRHTADVVLCAPPVTSTVIPRWWMSTSKRSTAMAIRSLKQTGEGSRWMWVQSDTVVGRGWLTIHSLKSTGGSQVGNSSSCSGGTSTSTTFSQFSPAGCSPSSGAPLCWPRPRVERMGGEFDKHRGRGGCNHVNECVHTDVVELGWYSISFQLHLPHTSNNNKHRHGHRLLTHKHSRPEAILRPQEMYILQRYWLSNVVEAPHINKRLPQRVSVGTER